MNENEQINDQLDESPDGSRRAAADRGGNKWTLFGRLTLTVVLAATVAYFVLAGTVTSGSGGSESVSSSAVSGRQSKEGSTESGNFGTPALGNANAPVTMIEYSDFQCPFCGKFARETEPALIGKYVEDGMLRIEWRDFPYLGQESVNAALAARAAQAQDKFWEYHEILYNNQKSTNSGAFSDENLIEYARQADLDTEQFEKDLQSDEYVEAVEADFQEGQQRGVTGTPTFFINGERLVGAQPAEVFEEAIEQAAEEAQDG